MNSILNKITKNLTNYQEISDEDVYLNDKISLEQIEEIFKAINGYDIEFDRVEDITYN